MVPDHVYFGLAVASLKHDGYGEVVAQPGVAQPPQSPLGVALSNKDVLVGRANLTITWGESSKLRLIADDILDNSNASGGQRLNNYLNGGISVLPLPALGIPALPIVTPNAPQLSNPFNSYDNLPADEDFFHRQGTSATYTQNLTSQLSLKLVGAYYEGHGQQFINFSETADNLFDVDGLYHDQQSSAEAQLAFSGDTVHAVGGFFYMDSNACGDYDADIGTLPLLGIPALDLYISELVSGCDLTKSTAVYGDSSWKLTDQLNLDVGLRWNQDKITAQVFQEDYVGAPITPGVTFTTPAQAPPGLIPFPGVVTDYTGERSFSNVDPRLGLDYHFTPNVMAYFTYSKGFKSGGFDMRGNALLSPDTKNGYNAETANNYELGLKSTLLDDTLLLNLTVFYDPYTDAQIELGEVTVFNGLPSNVTFTTNAGKQINEGAELQSAWRATRALTLGANVGYLDSYYKNYIVPCNIFPLTPQITPGCTPGGHRGRSVRGAGPAECPPLDGLGIPVLHMEFRGGLTRRARGLRLPHLRPYRVDHHGLERDRSTRIWTAECGPGIHQQRQALAGFLRRREPDQQVLPRRRLRVRPAAARFAATVQLRRRRERDRLLRTAAHLGADRPVPLLTEDLQR